MGRSLLALLPLAAAAMMLMLATVAPLQSVEADNHMYASALTMQVRTTHRQTDRQTGAAAGREEMGRVREEWQSCEGSELANSQRVQSSQLHLHPAAE